MSVQHGSMPPLVLVPFNRAEACSLRQAAKIAGRSESTVRGWCARYDIGRRVAGGPWMVSRAALQMLLDGNRAALESYLAGDRAGPAVARYFEALKACQILTGHVEHGSPVLLLREPV